MKTLLEKYGYMIEAYEEADYSEDGLEYEYGGGYWVYLKEDYICIPMECHTIHEETLEDVEAMLKATVFFPNYEDR